MKSPYSNKSEDKWLGITTKLVNNHPLKQSQIIDTVLKSWNNIFKSKIGSFYIGKDILPSPQIMSFLLHELIALDLEKQFPNLWKKGIEKNEKDIVCLIDDAYSIEIKASSDKKSIFGNRSYAQDESSTAQKSKSGYYLTTNFDKFILDNKPQINIIRFGYLDHTDWIGQAAATGQQARLNKSVYQLKLLTIYQRD